MSDFVDSKSDDRTVNNVMRHAYRVLSDDPILVRRKPRPSGRG